MDIYMYLISCIAKKKVVLACFSYCLIYIITIYNRKFGGPCIKYIVRNNKKKGQNYQKSQKKKNTSRL